MADTTVIISAYGHCLAEMLAYGVKSLRFQASKYNAEDDTHTPIGDAGSTLDAAMRYCNRRVSRFGTLTLTAHAFEVSESGLTSKEVWQRPIFDFKV